MSDIVFDDYVVGGIVCLAAAQLCHLFGIRVVAWIYSTAALALMFRIMLLR